MKRRVQASCAKRAASGAGRSRGSQRRLRLARHSLQREEHGFSKETPWCLGCRMRPSHRGIGAVGLQLAGGQGSPACCVWRRGPCRACRACHTRRLVSGLIMSEDPGRRGPACSDCVALHELQQRLTGLGPADAHHRPTHRLADARDSRVGHDASAQALSHRATHANQGSQYARVAYMICRGQESGAFTIKGPGFEATETSCRQPAPTLREDGRDHTAPSREGEVRSSKVRGPWRTAYAQTVGIYQGQVDKRRSDSRTVVTGPCP